MIEHDREVILSVTGSPLMQLHLEEGLAGKERVVLTFPSIVEGVRAAWRNVGDAMVFCADGFEKPGAPDYQDLWAVSEKRNIPVLVLGSHSDLCRKIDWLESGAADYILRPFDMDDLIARLAAHIRSRRQRRKLISTNAELSHEVKKLERLAIVDGLTQLYNHRYFQERLAAEFSRSMRHGTPVSLVLIDLDHFKEVNDLHGHQAGDDVLIGFSKTLKSEMRPSDLPARYGGEELVVILPETDADGALAIAERVRKALGSQSFIGRDGHRFTVTASFGIATLRGDMPNPAALINAADRSLYFAKGSGRNRTMVFEPEMASES
ncbi:MAG: diguanylate cyclase [Candidatus Coatesbacteria bacterium]|nr:diguanylate cyclase [Candidatus Coatesbacteria bacterium]